MSFFVTAYIIIVQVSNHKPFRNLHTHKTFERNKITTTVDKTEIITDAELSFWAEAHLHISKSKYGISMERLFHENICWCI